MGKTGKWIKNLFTGKKEKEEKKGITSTKTNSISRENQTLIQPNTTKEKKRWSFRRSTATTKDLNPMESIATTCLQEVQSMMESQNGQLKHAMAMAAATAAAADAAVKAAHAAATVIHLTTVATQRPSSVEEIAAIKIQSVFRSYLAKKALRALKGLVKLQALVRGHLVRKQANAALRCMQALVTVQARTRAQRMLMAQESQPVTQRQSTHRKPPHPHLQEYCVRQTYNDMEENIKIVEMDVERSSTHRSGYSSHKQVERADHRFSTHSSGYHGTSNPDHLHQMSPVPSGLTDMSPRTYSGYYEEHSINLEQNSPQSSVYKPENHFADYLFFPNYMANTESSKAKVRSQSAPKQRPDSYERQLSKQRLSMEGRNVPRPVRMQRSSSHVGSTAHEYQNPWSVKLDKSTVSLKDSECGSTSTILTNSNYCKSLVGYEVHASRC